VQGRRREAAAGGCAQAPGTIVVDFFLVLLNKVLGVLLFAAPIIMAVVAVVALVGLFLSWFTKY
jgi:hypothetical protein